MSPIVKEILASFDSWDIRKKNSLCCLLGACYGGLYHRLAKHDGSSYGEKILADMSATLNLFDQCIHEGELTQDGKNLVMTGYKELSDDSPFNDKRTILTMPALAFVLRNQDPSDVCDFVFELCKVIKTTEEVKEYAYVYVVILKAILDSIPSIIILETLHTKFSKNLGGFKTSVRLLEILQALKDNTDVILNKASPCETAIALVLVVLKLIGSISQSNPQCLNCEKPKCDVHVKSASADANANCDTVFKCGKCLQLRKCQDNHDNNFVRVKIKDQLVGGDQIIVVAFENKKLDEAPWWLYDTILGVAGKINDSDGFCASVLGSVTGAFIDSLGKIDDQLQCLPSLDAKIIMWMPQSRLAKFMKEDLCQRIIVRFNELYDISAVTQIVSGGSEPNKTFVIDCRGLPHPESQLQESWLALESKAPVAASAPSVVNANPDSETMINLQNRLLCFKLVLDNLLAEGLFPTVLKFACLRAMQETTDFKRVLDMDFIPRGSPGEIYDMEAFFIRDTILCVSSEEFAREQTGDIQQKETIGYLHAVFNSTPGTQAQDIAKTENVENFIEFMKKPVDYVIPAWKHQVSNKPFAFFSKMLELWQGQGNNSLAEAAKKSLNTGTTIRDIMQQIFNTTYGMDTDKLLYERTFSLGVLFRQKTRATEIFKNSIFTGEYFQSKTKIFAPLDAAFIGIDTKRLERLLAYSLGYWPREFSILHGESSMCKTVWSLPQAQFFGRQCYELRGDVSIIKKAINNQIKEAELDPRHNPLDHNTQIAKHCVKFEFIHWHETFIINAQGPEKQKALQMAQQALELSAADVKGLSEELSLDKLQGKDDALSLCILIINEIVTKWVNTGVRPSLGAGRDGAFKTIITFYRYQYAETLQEKDSRISQLEIASQIMGVALEEWDDAKFLLSVPPPNLAVLKEILKTLQDQKDSDLGRQIWQICSSQDAQKIKDELHKIMIFNDNKNMCKQFNWDGIATIRFPTQSNALIYILMIVAVVACVSCAYFFVL